MKKLLLLLILFFFSTQGFTASCPDGSEPVKSVSADGSYYVYHCGNTNNEQASSSTANSKTKAVAGISIENDPNIEFFKPPQKPYPTGKLYYFGRMWQMADFNNDGLAKLSVAIPLKISRVGTVFAPISSSSSFKIAVLFPIRSPILP